MPDNVLQILLSLLESMSVIIVIAYVLTRQKIYQRLLGSSATVLDRLYIALVFGCFSVYGTLSGIEVLDSVASVRDLGPAIAGLVAGPLAGLGAGLIGGVHRYSMGGVTALPCALSTIIAGIGAGAIHRARKGGFPPILWASLFMLLIEIMHMLLTLAICPDHMAALSVVRRVAPPMMIINTMGMAVFAFMFHNVLREHLHERTRILMESELMIAHDIQMSMVPGRSPRFPERPELDLHAVLKPAREVGGDLYDYFMVDGRRLCAVIGDVSGKGVPAALFMAVTKTLLKARAVMGFPPDEVLAGVNDELCRGNDSSMFTTVFMGILDPDSGLLTYSSGGHNLPYRLSAAGDVAPLAGTQGVALGVIPGSRFGLGTMRLAGGDTLLLHTDGVAEAMNTSGGFFGEGRMIECLASCRGFTAEETCAALMGEVERFASGAEQADDITLLALRSRDRGSPKVLELRKELSELTVLSEFISGFCAAHGVAEREGLDLTLALEEIVSNVMRHGTPDDGKSMIRVSVQMAEGLITAGVEDDGPAFDPLEAPAPDLNAPLEERRPGGLGILLARSMTDSMEYARVGHANVLVMTKRVGPNPPPAGPGGGA